MLIATEAVSKYHPDKIADQISDAILTNAYMMDKKSKVAVEVLIKDDLLVIAGEITSPLTIKEIKQIAKDTARKLGEKPKRIITRINKQSSEIKKAVNEIGAGDQGIVFGYATSKTKELLPEAVVLSNKIMHIVEDNVKDGILKGDAKCIVTEDSIKDKIVDISISVCHKKGIGLVELKDYIKTLLEDNNIKLDDITLRINPGGIWTKGGSKTDCGLTGRKIVADQYGAYARVGGGAFSGKDLTKVDRTAAYMARSYAKAYLKIHKLDEIEIELSYAIGDIKPQAVNVKAYKDNKLSANLSRLIEKDIIKLGQNHIEYAIQKGLYSYDFESLSSTNHYLNDKYII